MVNYLVVLFKNKKRKKIINKFVTFSRAKQYYDKLLKESNDVIYNVQIENGCDSIYEIGLVELSDSQLIPVYMTDEYGRNIQVKLSDDGMTLFQVSPYKKEERIYDIAKKKKITTQQLIKTYLKGDGLKMISSLNNKIIVQEDDKINLFTLKTELESSRFIDCLSSHFFKIKRGDCLFVKDNSSAQRKYLFNLLESYGIDKKILYRKFTSQPPSK
jgi:predicted transcriptional regulator with HTH domain